MHSGSLIDRRDLVDEVPPAPYSRNHTCQPLLNTIPLVEECVQMMPSHLFCRLGLSVHPVSHNVTTDTARYDTHSRIGLHSLDLSRIGPGANIEHPFLFDEPDRRSYGLTIPSVGLDTDVLPSFELKQSRRIQCDQPVLH